MSEHVGSELDSLFKELEEAEEVAHLARLKVYVQCTHVIRELTQKNKELESLVENLKKNNDALTKNNLKLSKELKDIQKYVSKKEGKK